MFTKKWEVNDPLPESADAIMLISYASTQKRLTKGSLETLDLAQEMSRKYPGAKIFWGTYSKNPSPNVERIEKEKVLQGSIYLGPVSSSTDECEAFIRALGSIFTPFTVIVIAEGNHSRRAKLVWKYLFPEANLVFRSIPGYLAADRENPMPFQRYDPLWFATNFCLTPFYKVIPGVMVKLNFSQPAI